MTVDRDPWRESAACAEIGGEPFFTDKGGSTVEAKRICGQCRVTQECLRDAMRYERGMSRKDRVGVFGGLSAGERHKLARATS